jgi:hypothetical protein
MAFITPGTAVAGEVLTAARWNQDVVANTIALPRGVLGVVTLTSGFSTSATHTTFQDITGMSVSVSYEANRRLRVTIRVNPFPSAIPSDILYRVLRGSTEIARFYVDDSALTASVAQNITHSHVFNGPATAGTETFKVQIANFNVNSPVTNYADGQYNSQLIVEDVGAA